MQHTLPPEVLIKSLILRREADITSPPQLKLASRSVYKLSSSFKCFLIEFEMNFISLTLSEMALIVYSLSKIDYDLPLSIEDDITSSLVGLGLLFKLFAI